MPTEQEIELAAAKLRGKNMRVSVRNVREQLPRGGSHSDIGPPLAAWKAKVNYRPKELPTEIPEGLAPVIEEFAAKLWAAAREEAETVVEDRVRQQAELERVYEIEAGIAWAEADRLTEEVKRLRGLLGEAGHEIGPMLPPMPSREARAEARRAWGGNEASPEFDLRKIKPAGVIERVGMRAANAIAKSGKEALTVNQIHAALDGLKDEYRRPLTKERVAHSLDYLAARTRHVRKVGKRYASLRPPVRPADPATRQRERRRADALVEELLAPLEEGWSFRHLLVDEITSRKFWDGVMRHAAFVIRASGKEALSAEEILAGLPPALIDKSGDFEPIAAGMLAEKLAFRSTKGKYVIDRKDGTFAAREDD